jgi:hypothetical protein
MLHRLRGSCVLGLVLPLFALGLVLSAPPAQAAGPKAFGPGSPACVDAANSLAFVESFARGPGIFRIIADWYARLLGERIAEHCVAMNQIQVLATHNSYHIEPRRDLLQTLLLFSDEFHAWEYTHLPLDQQFDNQGIRQIEIDVFADPVGGLYKNRQGLRLVGESPLSPDPAMAQPGFKVLHVQDLDFDVRCNTFVRCMQQVKAWSDAHPRHLPIGIQVELKDDPIIDPLQLGFAIPIKFNADLMDDLDEEIRSVFPPSRLITPDDVRGSHATLDEAVRQDGWPALAEARGKVIFVMDNEEPYRSLYRGGHPALEGRAIFTNAIPGEPDAAFVKLNDPLADATLIPEAVSQGYMVRTRADGDTKEARANNTVPRDAAIASGAQWVSTDYPAPDPRFSSYFVKIPDGHPARCNPVNAPPGCRNARLEELH